jgi:CRP-like cAMP-binding protein
MPSTLGFGPFMLLDPDVREALLAKSYERRFRQGDILMEELERSDDAYVLLEGSLRIVGGERLLAIVVAPALVGEMSVVTATGRMATVVADTPVRVLEIPGLELRRLIMTHRIFANAMRERADLILADAFLKRHSPLRDLPAEIVSNLVARLVPRDLAPDQLIEGGDDDLLLVRRGAVERMSDRERTAPGEFLQRVRGERYAAVGETWIYELRMADVAAEIIKHQEKVRGIAARLGDRARVRGASGAVAVVDEALGGALVHDAAHRAVVSEHVAALIPRLDGGADVATLVQSSGRTRGEIVEGLAMLVAAGLADIVRA